MQFIVGIDLGTTNSALAFAPTEGGAVTPFPIAQLARPGEVRDEPLLPSCLFLHGPADFAADKVALPWDPKPAYVTGQLAKLRGAEVPHRVIVSAKSWLCHGGVDRTAPILPTEAPDGVARISPVEASRRYLEHMRAAWNHTHPDAPLEKQHLLVTVPASFDAVARDLTLRAAREAGYGEVTLLEEPQAAFYAWIERHEDWRDRVRPGDSILVIDIGGGTSDFSLISVTEAAGQLELERVAVGEHILLGGDNMDLALAHHVAQELSGRGQKLDSMQMHSLWQNCRNAKEALFGAKAPAEYPVTILGRGSKLIGGSIKAALKRSDAERIVIDGFFPRVPSTEMPQRAPRSGFAEIGLPYAADAAVTRHLAQFLRQKANKLATPTHVLFNGGVFHASAIRERLLGVLNDWLAKEKAAPAKVLEGEDLMHAVSRGAAYYGLARSGRGIRIRGGISRTYYIGVQSSMPAVPGMKPPMKALTVAKFGMEEGTRAELRTRPFGLLVGEPAEFRFFASVTRKDDDPGVVLEEFGDELTELAPVSVTLPAEGQGGASVVPVTLETEITATGQLQLWCVAKDGRRWKLEFNVRAR
ncbi:MAG: Hsp70 family protein [Bryobacteraceae bacterium]